MRFLTNKKTRFTILLLSAALFPLRALADVGNPADFIHTRTYFGLMGTSVSIGSGGLFNGLNYSLMENPYEVDLIPSLAQNFGYGLMVGHREGAWALEVGFWQSTHNATFGPGVVTSNSGNPVTFTQQYQDAALYNSINVDFKRYFFTDSQVQPFLNLGVSFPWIVVNNAGIDAFGNTSSVSYAGLGLNVGIGVEYYLSPTFSVFGGATQRWASFDEFRGLAPVYSQISQNGTPASDEGSGLNFAVGATVGFE